MLFNMFDVPWTYEPRRFPLPSGSYLPDFFISSWECWVEIKGIHPTKHEQTLCEELQKVTKQSVIIAYGWPPTILVWTGSSWVSGNQFRILNTKLCFAGKPLPVETYQEINEKIWGTYGKKRKKRKQKDIRPSRSQKR